MDYSRGEIALSLYYKKLEGTDCGISSSGWVEENTGRNLVSNSSKKDFYITADSLRDEDWLPDLNSFQTISIVLPNTIHKCKKKNLKS